MHIPPPLIAVLVIAVLFIFNWLFPTLEFSFGGQKVLGGIVLLLGFGLVVLAGMPFVKAKTTVLPNRIEESSTLITSGIYQYSRNPMYLGMAFAIAGAGLGAGSLLMPLGVAGFILLINKVQIQPEETGLKVIFGKAYEDYCSNVRRWI